MSYPQNPNIIVLKNSFYPKGLREIDIWNYYQKNKNVLLKEALGKSLMVFFLVDLNKIVVIKRNKSKGLIRLIPSDYNEIVSGRTLSFHCLMDKFSNFGIVDIDIENFNKAKEATQEIYHLLEYAKFTTDLQIRFTGKTSFHIKVNFKNDYPISYIKQTLTEFFIENQNKTNIKYTVLSRKQKNIPNIDLNRNVFNAGHIALHSLSVLGLKCDEIPRINLLNSFRKEKTII